MLRLPTYFPQYAFPSALNYSDTVGQYYRIGCTDLQNKKCTRGYPSCLVQPFPPWVAGWREVPEFPSGIHTILLCKPSPWPKEHKTGYGRLSAGVFLCGHYLLRLVSRPQGPNLTIKQSRLRTRPFRTHVVHKTGEYTSHPRMIISWVEMNGSEQSIRLETRTT